ncbi:class I SAM-dependent methyltransferase [Pseudomonas syringae pv. actinidifoliorum]|uniref:class I SAM-dependent methyltransferase n=1 Tax=Pseudomonas syringae TaxID=317 RepID=UPI0013735FAA|nr:class I SAM-dependent methyltransferase [Pseudomonas syringae]MBL3828276.1 class I SAM-dependent methyltransferase [Pseudomonas syringae pv. theae]MBL3833580.1 class I SAM-dependent methyltransferase [Pseudomonas syringae pv. theae]MBL3866996.1 class I SAM-dependent methyltransferase [Pseudomonas syringae pv. theae]MDU8430194.1 class I SAM-dependent methyltransferase [Pseudomonas syringae pv. actinidifoliorum]MDU8520177.1 class I SAM-dependent methyltransferase [Pseudomonas syringae pv. act
MKTRKTLRDMYATHEGYVSDKWDIYLSKYNNLFNHIADAPIRLLEIGVQNGGSLEIWNQFFTEAKIIVGCDINPACAQLKYNSEKVHVVIGDVKASEVQKNINELSTDFDVIIDDGSHTSSDIIATFFSLLPKLSSGGIYIIEDLHCSYWSSFEGGLSDKKSSMNFLKSLTDIINHEHWGVSTSRSQFLSDFDIPTGIDAEKILSEIHSIEFVNSMCIVTKFPSQKNVLGIRHVVGLNETVAKNKHANGVFLSPEPQTETSQHLEDGKDEIIRRLSLEIAGLKSLLEKNGIEKT